ncbi:MAG: divalent-cation tolerance protein CutA [Thermoguttaceae bacterium]|nr:divalent-cation tolerance protein CutA [Thermoguttaceae bacterium]MDW8077936.1 divalent-cation tolerance protein CutA [Thermoguttaceae bacterium]
MTAEWVQVLTTTDRRELAETIARQLVEKRLAACVQIVGPILSIYRWQGAIEQAEEWQCLIKTQARLVDEVDREIRRLHTYQVPEIVVTPIVAGSRDYLEWIVQETSPPERAAD